MSTQEVKLHIKAGACGFVTSVTARTVAGGKVELEIQSDCEHVEEMAAALNPMDMAQALAGYGQGPIAQAAADNLAHGACPIPAGVIKAAEVALGLNVARDASISFD